MRMTSEVLEVPDVHLPTAMVIEETIATELPLDVHIQEPDSCQEVSTVEEEPKLHKPLDVSEIICYRCAHKGHYMHSCPMKKPKLLEEIPKVQKISPRDKSKKCYKCSQKGHYANQCSRVLVEQIPKVKKTLPRDKSKVKCYKCSQKGHYANQCSRVLVEQIPKKKTLPRDKSKIKCYKCSQKGHYANQCISTNYR
ncbi:hypothetical protein M8J76_006432 [Diaphorina citri]|nr:hypothetical protein M8J76_006432 [Diaphorina citri]